MERIVVVLVGATYDLVFDVALDMTSLSSHFIYTNVKAILLNLFR